MTRRTASLNTYLRRRGAWTAALLSAVVLLTALAGCPGSTLDGSLIVTNAAPGVLVTEVYLVPTGSTQWGSNLLLVPVEYGSSFLISGIEPGNYDEMAVAINLATHETSWLVNEAIRIDAGRTFTHLVYFTSPWP